MNLPSGIRATPAGKLMNVRTIGRRRLKNAVAAPYFGEEPVGDLDLVRADQQVPAVALEERPAAPRADGVRDQRAERVADRRHDHDDPEAPRAVGERLDWVGSETRKPAYGRISSDGSGIIADSIAIATITPT